MKKRVFTTMLLGMMLICSQAASFKYVYKGVTFKYKIEGATVCITAFDNDAAKVVIPAMVENYPVRAVDCFINGNNYLAIEVEIEEGVEEIAKFCFNEFRKLRSVKLPSTIKVIGSKAFRSKQANFEFAPGLDENLVSMVKRDYMGISYNEAPLLADNSKDVEKAIERKKQELERIRKSQELEEKKQELAALEEQTKAEKAKHDKTKAARELASAEKTKAAKEQQQRKLSDVDMDIPVNTVVKNDTYCFIIANETYSELPPVDYAENDGATFKEYCVKALGVPENHVFIYPNASFTAMTRAFQKMESLASATGGKSKFIFYYAGHGSPSEEDQSAYLVPSDGVVTVNTTCFKLADIYKRFGQMKAASITVLLDACFSGLNRDSGGLMAARAVARKPKAETVSGNVVVLSATSEAETAMAYKEKGHGMFTYHLLLKLKQAGGKVNLEDLYNSVSEGVRRDAIIVNDKNQTPSLSISPALKDKWKALAF